MNTGGLSCRNNFFRWGVVIETRDIFCNSPIEQFNVLWEIANRSTERLVGPLIEGGVVDTDASAYRRPYANQRAGQGRLAGAAGADNAETLPFAERKAGVINQRPLITRRDD